MAQFGLLAGEAQRPAGLPAGALGARGAELGAAHGDPPAGGNGELVGGELVHERALGGAVEEREPDGAPRESWSPPAPRALVDGVADPHSERPIGGDGA